MKAILAIISIVICACFIAGGDKAWQAEDYRLAYQLTAANTDEADSFSSDVALLNKGRLISVVHFNQYRHSHQKQGKEAIRHSHLAALAPNKCITRKHGIYRFYQTQYLPLFLRDCALLI